MTPAGLPKFGAEVVVLSIRGTWSVAGRLIGHVPADEALSGQEMLAFYNLGPHDALYRSLADAQPNPRLVVLKPSGTISVIPQTEHVAVVTPFVPTPKDTPE